jgi:uncharacterized phage-associated protein
MRNECVVRLMERLVKDTKESEDVAAIMKKVVKFLEKYSRTKLSKCTHVKRTSCNKPAADL